MIQEDLRVKEIREQFDRWKDARQDWDVAAREDIDFYLGNHFTQAELDEFNQRPVAPLSQPIDPTGMLPQTSDSVILPRQTSLQDELGIKGDIGVEGEDPGRFTATPPTGDVFAAGDYSDVAGTLADPREKLDVITAEDAADPDGLLAKLGIPGFNAQEALVKAAINKAVGGPITLLIDG